MGALQHPHARRRDFREPRSGSNIDDILSWYEGLDRDQVKAVIEFAARSLDTPVASR
jgi:uncharacterized protein (DUF433 family)